MKAGSVRNVTPRQLFWGNGREVKMLKRGKKLKKDLTRVKKYYNFAA